MMKKYTINNKEVEVYLLSEVKELLQEDKIQYHRLVRVFEKHNKNFPDNKIIGFMQKDLVFIQMYESDIKY
jgi:hypothetical protein